jgi:Transposase DDE domain group 1
VELLATAPRWRRASLAARSCADILKSPPRAILHHDERGFAPIHIYHVASGTPVVAILRAARTAKGTEVRCVIKHVIKRLRKHWPNTRIVWRGDGHCGRVEEMERAESDGTDYIFGLAGTVLDALVAETADNLRFHRAGAGPRPAP